MKGRPLSDEKYDESRWIVEPVNRLFDCCQENDGAAAVILAATIVESQSRESGHRLGADLPGVERKELVWLHRLRNRLLHERTGEPVLTIEDQWGRRDIWEGRARRALEVAFAALYSPLGRSEQ